MVDWFISLLDQFSKCLHMCFLCILFYLSLGEDLRWVIAAALCRVLPLKAKSLVTTTSIFSCLTRIGPSIQTQVFCKIFIVAKVFRLDVTKSLNRKLGILYLIELEWCRNISLTNYIELGCCRKISLATTLLLVTRIWIRTWMMELHSHVHQCLPNVAKCDGIVQIVHECSRMQSLLRLTSFPHTISCNGG